VTTTGILVTTPVASFRVPHAREYFETLPCPPPSTVYGMLLSMVGEEQRATHSGAEVAVALLGRPATSTVLRTVWRVKEKKTPLGIKPNARPDFQELLSPVDIAVFLRPGLDGADKPLSRRVAEAMDEPGAVSRHGALSLGESTHMVNDVVPWPDDEEVTGRLLLRAAEGPLCLPVWVDHVGSAGTRFQNYRLEQMALRQPLPEEAWTRISEEPPCE